MTIKYNESLKNNQLNMFIPAIKLDHERRTNKMAYDAKESKEIQGIPPGTSTEGVIVALDDGTVKEFVKNTDGWKGDVNQTAINIGIELKYGEKVMKLSQVFTYDSEEGKTVFSSKSNLGKYKKYYNKLPEVGDKVKLLSNKDGFFRLLIE